MKSFKPKSSVTENDIIEREAIKCLEAILIHDDIKTHFSLGDKGANIDGKIELLTDRCVFGNITVQIKSYPEKYRGLSKFDFPTSIFGYADRCANELVLFFAVDRKEKLAYWKHINLLLIEKNKDKSAQESITLYFEESEILTNRNIDETVDLWKELHGKTCNLLIHAEGIEKENEELKIQLGQYQDSRFSIGKRSVSRIQSFIDEYNYLLDYEYTIVRQTKYSNSWKIGIAILKYEATELSYILYNIEKGENGLLIREIPTTKVKEFERWTLMYQNCLENPIDQNPRKYALNLVHKKVMELLERKEFLFLTKETANEYIFDFIEKEGNHIGIARGESYKLDDLLTFLQINFPRIESSNQVLVVKGDRNIDIKSLYQNISFLTDRGFYSIQRLYPNKGHFGNTGFVTDWYSPEQAFQKVKFAYEILPFLFESYVSTIFPLLVEKVTFYKEFDLILVNLEYLNNTKKSSDFGCQLSLCFFKSINKKDFYQDIIISLNYDSNIYKENIISDYESLTEFWDRDLIYQENSYEFKMQMAEEATMLFDKYYLQNLLYKHLQKRFQEYLKKSKSVSA